MIDVSAICFMIFDESVKLSFLFCYLVGGGRKK